MISPNNESQPTFLWLAAAPEDDEGEHKQRRDSCALDVRSLRILIVEDEFFISLDMQNILQDLGHTVVGIAVSADEAVRLARQTRPEVALVDIRLVGPRDGIEAANEMRRFGVPAIFVTAHNDPQTRARADAVAPLGFVAKPVNAQRLQLELRNVPRLKPGP